MAQNQLLLSGLLINGQRVEMAPASYHQVATRLSILRTPAVPPVVPSGDTVLQVLVDEIAVGTFTIAAAAKKQTAAINVSVLAEKTTAVVVTEHGGAADLSVWFELALPTAQGSSGWIVPGPSQLLDEISAPEYAAFTNPAITGGRDRIPGLLDDAVKELRAAIRTGKRNDLGPVGTIPDEAFSGWMHGVKWHFFDYLKSVPQFADRCKDAKKEWDGFLDKVREGKVVFIEPTVVGEALPQLVAYGSEPRVQW